MKNSTLLSFWCGISFLLCFSSCQKITFDDDEGIPSSNCTFTFSLFTPSAYRASSVSDFRCIIIMDIVDGKIKQVVKNTSSDANFGKPSLILENGTHTLRFIATYANDYSFNSYTLSQIPIGDTFVHTLTINTKEAELNQHVVLNRNVARIIYTGDGSVTLNGILSDFDMFQYEPVGEISSVVLTKDEYTYSFIPASGFLMLSNNTAVPVKANAVTVVKDNGTEVGPGGDVPTEGELLVLTNDTAQFYVPKMEIKDIMLSVTGQFIKVFEIGESGKLKIGKIYSPSFHSVGYIF